MAMTEKGILQRARWIDKLHEKMLHHLRVMEEEGGELGREVSYNYRGDAFMASCVHHAEAAIKNQDSD